MKKLWSVIIIIIIIIILLLPKVILLTFSKRGQEKHINENKFIMSKDMKWKYFYHNPTAPTMGSLIEIHEINTIIRPIVKWISATAYKLPTLTVNNLEISIPLPRVSNVKITIQLIDDLLAIPHNKDRKLSLLMLRTRIRKFPSKNYSKSSN
jgi:hypothetical protein